MESSAISKMSQKGQVVIPVKIRKELDLHAGDKLPFTVKNGEINVQKLPTSLDWAEVIKDIPVENVDIDEDGHYDAEKSPNFHDWMVNG